MRMTLGHGITNWDLVGMEILTYKILQTSIELNDIVMDRS
jgi:hypothetical protein